MYGCLLVGGGGGGGYYISFVCCSQYLGKFFWVSDWVGIVWYCMVYSETPREGLFIKVSVIRKGIICKASLVKVWVVMYSSSGTEVTERWV